MCPAGFAFSTEPGLRLEKRMYLEPDLVVFEDSVDFPSLKGAEVLLAVEVADSSLSYDLGRKSRLYAGLGVHELWVVDTRRSIVHRHRDPAPGGYARIDRLGASDKLVPALAPAEFAFSLDEISRIPRRK